jgi:hypothetical protein
MFRTDSVLKNFFFLVVLEFELRALSSLGRCSATLEPLPLAFVLWGFGERGSHFTPWTTLDLHPPIYTSRVAEMTGIHYHTQLLIA